MPGFQPWTHEKCPLYTARVKLTKEGRILDEVTFRFGMREIGVKDRHYKLNGKNLWLRGSNLVFEWNWGDTITRQGEGLPGHRSPRDEHELLPHAHPTAAAAVVRHLRRARDHDPGRVPGALQLPGLQVHAGGVRNLAPQRAHRLGRLDGPALEPSLGHHVGLVQRIAGRQRLGRRAVPGLRQRTRSHAADDAHGHHGDQGELRRPPVRQRHGNG